MRTRIALLAAAAVLLTASAAQALGFATYFVVLAPGGAVATSFGVTSSLHTGVGIYDVVFNRSITGCALLATVNGATPGFASIQRKAGGP
jgi:hypothetical protein